MKRIVVLLLVLSTLLPAGCTSRSAVKKTLEEDPELLLEVLRENRFKLLELIQSTIDEEQALARQQQLKAAAANPLDPKLRTSSVVEGDAKAPITIIEYSDFLCPYCVRGHETMNALLDKYPGKIRLVYKHNPIKKGAWSLAALYEAVAEVEPAKATELKNILFSRQEDIHEAGEEQGEVVRAIISELGLDVSQLEGIARSQEVREAIKADTDELHAFNLSGTPMFIVGGVPVRGAVPMDEFEAVIELLQSQEQAK